MSPGFSGSGEFAELTRKTALTARSNSSAECPWRSFTSRLYGRIRSWLSGEKHGKEPVVVLAPCVVWVARAALLAHPHGACCSVMTVGYVRDRHGCECFHVIAASPDTPHGVSDPVRRDKVRGRFFTLKRVVHEDVDLSVVSVRQEDRARVGAESVNEFGAIVLFVFACLFVFFDDVLLVVINVAHAGNAGLHMVAHGLLVEIKAGLGFTHQRTRGLQSLEFRKRRFVHNLRVGIGVFWQMNLRTVHVHERVRVPCSQCRSLFGVDHVVWNTGDLGDERWGGDETLE